MDTVEIYIQVDINKTASGKKRTNCTLLSTPAQGRYTTEIGFMAYSEGKTKGGFTPTADRTNILIAHLYWTAESFKDKKLLYKVSEQLFLAIKRAMNDSGLLENSAIRFEDSQWKIHEYWTLE